MAMMLSAITVPWAGERIATFMFSAPGCIIIASSPLGIGLCREDEVDEVPPHAATNNGAERIEAINRCETCIFAPSRYPQTRAAQAAAGSATPAEEVYSLFTSGGA